MTARGPYQFNKTGAIESHLRKEYLRLVSNQFLEKTSTNGLQRTFEMYVSQKMLEQIQKVIRELVEKFAHLSRLETEVKLSEELFPITGAFIVKPFDGWGTLLSRVSPDTLK